jgi:hypothetical protein
VELSNGVSACPEDLEELGAVRVVRAAEEGSAVLFTTLDRASRSFGGL